MRLFEPDALCDDTDVDSDETTRAIEREVEQAACGQVCALSVVRDGDLFILRGRCRTYHTRLLARQAALDLIDGSGRLIDLILIQ